MCLFQIIVMSATMDVDHFSQYFNNAPVLYIEGRQYPIRVSLYMIDTHQLNVQETRLLIEPPHVISNNVAF